MGRQVPANGRWKIVIACVWHFAIGSVLAKAGSNCVSASAPPQTTAFALPDGDACGTPE
jgi:hypothetical protein